jgi:hypothetical protein
MSQCNRSHFQPNADLSGIVFDEVNTVVSRIFRTFGLAERRPALAHAVMAPLICWSFSSSMLLDERGPRLLALLLF